METNELWRRRAELLRRARDGRISFREFNLLTLHKETKDLIARDIPTLSEKGFRTLFAIETFLGEE